MPTRVVIPYQPRPLQLEFHNNIKRWNVLVTHRRFGKTVMVVNQLIKDAALSKKERPRFAYIAPYFTMAKTIAWDYLKHYSRVIPGMAYNESDLKATFPNGATISLLGADNPDRLRGIYLDGVALDEYAQIRPSLFTEVISPALSDRKGYAIFLGTPRGKANNFHELYQHALADDEWFVALHKSSETGYVEEEELERLKTLLNADEYAQEMECSFEAAIKGAYYAAEIKAARTENRICNSVYDKNLEVHTAWDLGITDSTAITFFQLHGKEIRIVDYLEDSGRAIGEYVALLRDKGYKYGKHAVPWDARVTHLSSGKSTLSALQEAGLDNVSVVPNIRVQQGINQVRKIFPRIWFEKSKTKELVELLTQYRKEFDEKLMTFKARPLHDFTSHGSDSFRYMALAIKEQEPKSNDEDDVAQFMKSKKTFISPKQPYKTPIEFREEQKEFEELLKS